MMIIKCVKVSMVNIERSYQKVILTNSFTQNDIQHFRCSSSNFNMKFTKRTLPKSNFELSCLTSKIEKDSKLSKWNDECCPLSKYKKRHPGDNCKPSLNILDTHCLWECRVPEPLECCGGTNRELDPRCMPIIGGYDHPHVIMFDDYSYYIKIEFPEMF